VNAGDSKGQQQGKVQEVIVAKSRVIVEGILTLFPKHTKPNAAT